MRFFLDHSVEMAIDGWIDAESEDVLMVLGQHARTDYVAVIAGLASIDVDRADNTSGTCLNVDATRLIELVGENVLVVGQCDDELHYQLAAACDYRPSSSPVGVFPADAVVLLMKEITLG